jgi:prepilin-type N-terminal cleavage/methylation domain-containing protein
MKSKGFTLIELMIVVFIIAILTAIFIPALQQYKAEQERYEHTVDDVHVPEQVIAQDPAEVEELTEELTPLYIDRTMRSEDYVVLKKHADGVLYACVETDGSEKCYKVKK